MRRRIISFIFIFFIFVFALSTTSAHAFWWMAYHKPAFKGKVIDAETKEPIEGAVVVAVYTKTSMGIAESYSVTINVKENLTDKNGEFYIPSYTTIIQPLSWEDKTTFIIFKPGYGSFPGNPQSPSGLRPIDEEIFFSKEAFGKEGELELWVKGVKKPELKKFKLSFGLVELPKLKTREERRKASRVGVTGYRSKDLPLLYKALNEEQRYLGIPESE